ncbi:hypothetical protein M1116_03000 [Patescibacteria group bacterium]|nr:hypothetical protein [Patescibacteria group bacterium]
MTKILTLFRYLFGAYALLVSFSSLLHHLSIWAILFFACLGFYILPLKVGKWRYLLIGGIALSLLMGLKNQVI